MNNRNFKEAVAHRRSYYHISNSSPISNDEIKGIIAYALKHAPSAFNSQTTRIVLLLNNSHKRLWDITKMVLKAIVPEKAFPKTEAKIDSSFASGYGTILFFEDMSIVEQLQTKFPDFKDNFPTWAQHTSAIHQYVIWTMLEDAGLGASLQHYNPLIDEMVQKEWNLNPKWKLIAQMPFGRPTQMPEEKTFNPIEERLFTYY